MSKLLEEKWIERIADEVARQLRQYGRIRLPEQLQYPGAEVDGEEVEDLVSKEAREKSQLRAPWDPGAASTDEKVYHRPNCRWPHGIAVVNPNLYHAPGGSRQGQGFRIHGCGSSFAGVSGPVFYSILL